jgi:hypothetical protein
MSTHWKNWNWSSSRNCCWRKNCFSDKPLIF